MSSISDSQLAFAPFTKAYNDTGADIVGALNVGTPVRLLVPTVTAGWYNFVFSGQISALTNNTLTGFAINLFSDAGGVTRLACVNIPLQPPAFLGTATRVEMQATVYVSDGAVYTNFRSTGSASTIISQAYTFVTDTGFSVSWVRAQR
jgi:hypothetical protein